MRVHISICEVPLLSDLLVNRVLHRRLAVGVLANLGDEHTFTFHVSESFSFDGGVASIAVNLVIALVRFGNPLLELVLVSLNELGVVRYGLLVLFFKNGLH